MGQKTRSYGRWRQLNNRTAGRAFLDVSLLYGNIAPHASAYDAANGAKRQEIKGIGVAAVHMFDCGSRVGSSSVRAQLLTSSPEARSQAIWL